MFSISDWKLLTRPYVFDVFCSMLYFACCLFWYTVVISHAHFEKRDEADGNHHGYDEYEDHNQDDDDAQAHYNMMNLSMKIMMTITITT